jgi:hypothetical protein
MISIDYGRRRARGGQHKLPANPKQWPFEHHALDLRDDLGLRLDVQLNVLDAFGAVLPHVEVKAHGDVHVSDHTIRHWRERGNKSWSGMAVRMHDGTETVLYNDAHSEHRVRATLMEELFHIRLGHPRSSVRMLSDGTAGRTFNGAVEEEAYASGAAALLPYGGLRGFVNDGLDSSEISRIYNVSPDLVNYRLKVTKLFGTAQRKRTIRPRKRLR